MFGLNYWLSVHNESMRNSVLLDRDFLKTSNAKIVWQNNECKSKDTKENIEEKLNFKEKNLND